MGDVEKIKMSESKFKKALSRGLTKEPKITAAQVEQAFTIVSSAVSRAVMNKDDHKLAENALVLLSQALVPHYPPSKRQ